LRVDRITSNQKAKLGGTNVKKVTLQEAAAALGRAGGRATAKRMTKRERVARAKKGGEAFWERYRAMQALMEQAKPQADLFGKEGN
jgi:hypothetical protein